MKKFMDENFLLDNEVSQELYHQHAAKMPIIDYHCHLIPAMVANDHKFKSITELWLGGDHYKWRALRGNGVCCTNERCAGGAYDLHARRTRQLGQGIRTDRSDRVALYNNQIKNGSGAATLLSFLHKKKATEKRWLWKESHILTEFSSMVAKYNSVSTQYFGCPIF